MVPGDSSLCVSSGCNGFVIRDSSWNGFVLNILDISLTAKHKHRQIFQQFNHILCNAPKSITHTGNRQGYLLVKYSPDSNRNIDIIFVVILSTNSCQK